MTPEDVALAFTRLESALSFIPNEYATKESDVFTEWGPTLLAIDSNGRRQLLLPIDSAGSAPIDQHSSGVHILPLHLNTNASAVRTAGKAYRPYFVALVCLKEHLNDVFNLLVAETLKAVEHLPTKPEKAAIQVLEKWREFLNRERSLRLSDHEVAGLIGELLVLRDLIGVSVTAMKNWHGPDRSRHDFANERVALEVKTTIARSGWKFEIHGHDQLERPVSTPLFFAGVRLQKDPAGSITLPSLIETIFSAGVVSNDFEEKLLDVGYVASEAPVYEKMRFEERERRFYLVNEQFPKLTSQSFLAGKIPDGVEKICYFINLNGSVPYTLEKSAVEGLLQELAL